MTVDGLMFFPTTLSWTLAEDMREGLPGMETKLLLLFAQQAAPGSLVSLSPLCLPVPSMTPHDLGAVGAGS